MATYQMRAMSLGEILDGAFSVYRRHFGTLFGIAVVCYGIPALLDVYIELRGGVLLVAGLWLLARILSAVGGLIAAGATVKVVSDAYLGCEPIMGDAMQFAAGRMLRILVSGVAKYVLVLLATLLLVIPGIIVACGYAVVVQAVVLEDLPRPTDALRRSWTLTRGYKGKVFLLYAVLFLLLILPLVAAGTAAAFLPAAALFVALVQILIYPVFGCALTLFYYDLRVRKEAFDLEHLSQQIGRAEPGRT